MESTEASVLGAALSEPGLWLAEADRITPNLFIEHATLGRVLCDLRDTGEPTDPQAVAAYTQRKGHPVAVSDLMALAELAPASSAGMKQAVRTLVDRSKRHALAKLGGVLSRLAFDAKQRPDDMVVEAVAKLMDIGARSTRAIKPLRDVLPEVIRELNHPPVGSIKTGIQMVDNICGGLLPGALVVLGARPSMGKTALASGIARQAALAGQTVAFISLEMSAKQIAHRLLADLGNADLARISAHRLHPGEMDKIVNAAGRLHKTAIFVGETDKGLNAVCRQLKHQHGLDLIVVDYLQLMHTRADSREQEIAKISRELKQLARDVQVPVLVLSQLNRSLEARQLKRPRLSDLRESGAIEQDADMVFLLWRPGFYDENEDQTGAELVLAKNRNGPVGTIPLVFDETRARFSQPKTS